MHSTQKIHKHKSTILGLDGQPLRMEKPARSLLSSGYSNSAASLVKPVFKGWQWQGGAPDDDIVANLPIIRQRSRQLTMDAPVIAGLYKTLTTNCVGDGLRPEPTPDAEYLGMSSEDVQKWKATVLRFWETFAETQNCDVYRRDNFYELTRLVSRAQDESGDVFVTMPMFERRNVPFALKLQVVEADCVSDPDGFDSLKYEVGGNDIFGGVEISEYGHVLAYWFYTGHPLAHRIPRNYQNHNSRRRFIRIPAYGEETGRPNVLHLMESLRPGQRRGLPLISPVIELALTLDRYMKAEAIAAQIQAMFALIITSESPDAMAAEVGALFGENSEEYSEYRRDMYSRSDVLLGNGIVQYARPGESVTPVDPSRPTTAFEPFVNSVLQMCGPSLGTPYELLMQKFDASYSASRAAMNMASAGFKVKRSGLVNDFCQPVYEAFLDEAVARGWIPAKGYWDDPITRKAYTRAKWNGPGMPQIDLLKEVAAAEKRIALGASTYGDAARELTGTDFLENIKEIGREREVARRAGVPLPEPAASSAAGGGGFVRQ